MYFNFILKRLVSNETYTLLPDLYAHVYICFEEATV